MEKTPRRNASEILNVSYCNPIVTASIANLINSNSIIVPSNDHLHAGRVLTTPLSFTDLSKKQDTIKKKILIKAVLKSYKKDPKTFTLRDVNISKIVTCDYLKLLIKSQFNNDLSKDFDVGYYDGSTVVSIRSEEDFREVWCSIKEGSKIILWCDGLKEAKASTSRKRKRLELDDSEFHEEDKQKSSRKKSAISVERENKVEEWVKNLQELHASK